MVQSGLVPFRGYHTIRLENYVPVKKGKLWAVVRFAGNAYYNKASKKVKISVKA